MGTIGVFTSARKPDDSPFGRIIAATMRGNAMVQGQSQAKDVASDQMDADPPKVTITGKTTPKGIPIIKFEGPADLLNGTQESDIQQAHDTPHVNVERKLDQLGIGTGASQSEFLRSHGYTPSKTDYKPEDLDTFKEAFVAQRRQGEGLVSSATKALATKVGLFSRARMAEDFSNSNALRNAAAEKAIGQGIEPEVNVAQVEGAGVTRGLAARGQYLSTRDKLLDQKNINPAIFGGSEADYLSAVGDALAPFGGLSPDDSSAFKNAFRTGRVSFLNDRVKALSGEEGKAAVQNYDATNIQGFISDQVGVDPESLSTRERNRFVSIFAGQQEQKRIAQLKEERAEEDQRLQVKRDQRLEELAREVGAGRLDVQRANIEQKKFQQAASLRDDYRTEITQYRDLDLRFEQIAALASKANSASDIALLYQYMKALDSNSVVRESEFKTAAGIGSVFTRMQQAVQNAYNGERLTDQNRKAIVDTVGALRQALGPRQDKVKDFFRNAAKKYNLDPSLIGYDIAGKRRVYDPSTDSFVEK